MISLLLAAAGSPDDIEGLGLPRIKGILEC